ncbi:hypothetical protein G5B39_01270 [Rhodobacteraceae bacterium SC52]|nr:hypothetical protein G5B39_01270 [Rhodobacteraceae bacterium SC52]
MFDPQDSRAPLPGHGQPVEDYTNAFLVTACGLVFCTLFALWAMYGLFAALAVAWVADRALLRFMTRQRH